MVRISLLFAVIGLAAANPSLSGRNAPQPSCTNGKLVPGTTCTQECRTDRPRESTSENILPLHIRVSTHHFSDGDFRKLNFQDRRTGLQRCAQACNAEKICMTAEYRMDTGYCYLKSRTNAPIRDSNVNGAVCRRPGSPPTYPVSIPRFKLSASLY